MPDEPNPAVAGPESPAGDGAGASPESAPAKETSTPASAADWKAGFQGASDDELLELLEKRNAIKERLGQSHADRVLLKDRERITSEIRQKAELEAQQVAWQGKWNNMSRAERAEFLLQNQEMQDQQGRMIGEWWNAQSKTVKDAIPELKGKTIEEWTRVFQEHPNSWGETMAALVEEVVKDRLAKALEKDVPAQAKIMAEALLKDKIANTLAKGDAPDVRSTGPAGGASDKGFVSDYAKGDSNDHVAAYRWYQDTLKG